MKNLKIKRIILTDIALIPIFIGVIVTGFGLHTAAKQHGAIDLMWEDLHKIFAILSLIVVVIHIFQHWIWYKGLFNRTGAKRSKLTVALSIMFVVTTLSAFLVDINFFFGLLHYKFGVVLTIISFVHIVKRFKWLRNSLTK